jgi:hypothetical protein
MVTLLITSFFILALAAIAIYFWQKPARTAEVRHLPQPPARGLFNDGPTESPTLSLAESASESEAAATRRRELVERAAVGERSTLLESHKAKDVELYDEVLGSFINAADSDPKLLSLVSYVTSHELRVNKQLAEKIIESYRRTPNRSATAKTLHIAALSNDAAVYQNAVEIVLTFWREGRLPEVSAQELRSILDGEFWILSSSTRSSGAGFLLKRVLRNARRELESIQNV